MAVDMRTEEQQMRLRWVFDDHPWLIDVLRTADHWVTPEGRVQVRYHVEDLAAAEPGLRAMAKALGQAYETLPPDAATPSTPDGPPVGLEDARRHVEELT